MSSVSIGITAMELFAYNPFRILGIPVNAPHAEIAATYDKLVRLADSGDITAYKTPYDFDSLPPFSRSAQTVKTAHAKLASNGYRCFAYADSDFSVSLNIDDIMLNLRDISCYDCFLRCYMWLIINDREMNEHDLWIQLANYIDKLIMSDPSEWTKYFDHRFPDEMVDESMNAYKSFYSTFCEIILLPLKEMVRGSMKCRSAKEILQCAKIDVNEQFEPIDIPQANAPKNPGDPQPKLKIALKYGDEYFDISSGSMVSYSETTAASESNSFDMPAAAPLSAEAITSEPEPAAEPEQQSYYEEPAYTAPEPQQPAYQEPEYQEPAYQEPAYQEPAYEEPAPAPEPEPAPTFQQPAAPQQTQPQPPTSRRSRRGENLQMPGQSKPAAPQATQPITDKGEPLQLGGFQNSPSVTPQQPKPAAPQQPAQPRRSRSLKNSEGAGQGQTAAPVQPQSGAFGSDNPFFDLNANKVQTAQDKSGTAVRASSYNKIVEDAAKKEQAAAQAEQEAIAQQEAAEMDEENMYANALIELLRSSASRGETMKSVDTTRTVSAKEMAGPSHTSAAMDEIDMRRYDEKNLASNSGRMMTLEEKYRNINIDDMMTTGGTGINYGPSAIEQFKKAKQEEKEQRRSLMLTIGIVAICLAIAVVLWQMGIIG
ncbi:hypothetical protein SAMN02910447_03524 [Ruminococcus sp. YE71]|uniref:hypothetical protein n=1 Tax=unclassified Ruminococcus TaxID=2608920 RepID=UPI0008833D62|nr:MULTISPECIES: hypothetical protein [unclassified Ruminococcus]SDA32465.1 hypothetical protein SAMN02910446_03597 [Ruminococcus sp. YE78]SFW53395.1 hypothetical protein SAMN02910447_03524 [Ruminococcus sp. YE71]